MVTFKRLEREQLAEIVELQARAVCGAAERAADRARADRRAAAEMLVKQGYDPAYGARPLKRTMQRELENPLALKVLSGEIRDGDSVSVDAADDAITIAVEHAQEAVAVG